METFILDRMQEVFEAAARYFSVLAEPARLKILHAICNGEKSVNHIMSVTGMAQANASRHLGLMYQAGLLNRRREGTQVFYRVTDLFFLELCRTVSAQIAFRAGQVGADHLFVTDSSSFHLDSPISIPTSTSNHKEQASV
jgi:DNA-binding transcriptional ArsR family regulator